MSNINVRPRPEPVFVNDVSDLDNLTLSEGQLISQLGLQALLGLDKEGKVISA